MKRKNRILAILFLIIIHFTNAQKKCDSSNEYLEDLHSIKKCTLEKKGTNFTKKSVDISIEKPLSRRNFVRRKRLKKIVINTTYRQLSNRKKRDTLKNNNL